MPDSFPWRAKHTPFYRCCASATPATPFSPGDSLADRPSTALGSVQPSKIPDVRLYVDYH